MQNAARTIPAQKAADTPPAVLIFDDGSSFDYLSEIEEFNFYKCRTFEDVEDRLSQIRRGELDPPCLLALDIYCDAHRDFSLFEVDEAVDPARCGIQLYELVLREQGENFAKAPVLFFTSHSAQVGNLSIQRVAKTAGVTVRNCTRVEFREELVRLAVDMKLADPAAIARPLGGLTQDDYFALFAVLADEFQLDARERCVFFGLQSGRSDRISDFLSLSTMANERIDLALAISVLLDRLVTQKIKRRYLEDALPAGDRQGFDLLVGGSVQDLLEVKAHLEMKLGGEIL